MQYNPCNSYISWSQWRDQWHSFDSNKLPHWGNAYISPRNVNLHYLPKTLLLLYYYWMAMSSHNTSSEVLLPVFVTVTLTVTFWPALTVVGSIFKPEYLKVVYDLQELRFDFLKVRNYKLNTHTVRIQKETRGLLQSNDMFCWPLCSLWCQEPMCTYSIMNDKQGWW